MHKGTAGRGSNPWNVPAVALGTGLEGVNRMTAITKTSIPHDVDGPRSRITDIPPSSRGLRHILVCLDRSTAAEASLSYAIALARAFGSGVTLLYVMQPAQGHCAGDVPDPLDWELSRREASAYLDRLARQATETWGLSVETRIEQGHPAERITATARGIGEVLTVIASHGEGGSTASSLGSTAQRILAVSRGSVLVTRATSSAPSVITPKRILVPLDGSLRTESVLPTVERIAEAYGAEVVLAHVVPEPLPTAVLHTGDLDLARELAGRLESRAKRYLEHVRGRMPRDTSVRIRVTRHADERQSLLDISLQERADLVVLSAHGSVCNPRRVFGSVTQHLLAHSMAPLLVLQDLSDLELERAGKERDRSSAPPPRSSHSLRPG